MSALFSGYLQILSDSKSERIFMVLDKSQLACFIEDPSKTPSLRLKPFSVFNVDSIRLVDSETFKKPKSFAIASTTSNLFAEFACPTNSNKCQWVKAVSDAIAAAPPVVPLRSVQQKPSIPSAVKQTPYLVAQQQNGYGRDESPKKIMSPSKVRPTTHSSPRVRSPNASARDLTEREKPRWIPQYYGTHKHFSRALSPDQITAEKPVVGSTSLDYNDRQQHRQHDHSRRSLEKQFSESEYSTDQQQQQYQQRQRQPNGSRRQVQYDSHDNSEQEQQDHQQQQHESHAQSLRARDYADERIPFSDKRRLRTVDRPAVALKTRNSFPIGDNTRPHTSMYNDSGSTSVLHKRVLRHNPPKNKYYQPFDYERPDNNNSTWRAPVLSRVQSAPRQPPPERDLQYLGEVVTAAASKDSREQALERSRRNAKDRTVIKEVDILSPVYQVSPSLKLQYRSFGSSQERERAPQDRRARQLQRIEIERRKLELMEAEQQLNESSDYEVPQNQFPVPQPQHLQRQPQHQRQGQQRPQAAATIDSNDVSSSEDDEKRTQQRRDELVRNRQQQHQMQRLIAHSKFAKRSPSPDSRQNSPTARHNRNDHSNTGGDKQSSGALHFNSSGDSRRSSVHGTASFFDFKQKSRSASMALSPPLDNIPASNRDHKSEANHSSGGKQQALTDAVQSSDEIIEAVKAASNTLTSSRRDSLTANRPALHYGGSRRADAADEQPVDTIKSGSDDLDYNKQADRSNNNGNGHDQSMTDLAEWKRLTEWMCGHGFSQYLDTMRAFGITKLSVMELLREEDLAYVGVSAADVQLLLRQIYEFSRRTRSFSEQALLLETKNSLRHHAFSGINNNSSSSNNNVNNNRPVTTSNIFKPNAKGATHDQKHRNVNNTKTIANDNTQVHISPQKLRPVMAAHTPTLTTTAAELSHMQHALRSASPRNDPAYQRIIRNKLQLRESLLRTFDAGETDRFFHTWKQATLLFMNEDSLHFNPQRPALFNARQAIEFHLHLHFAIFPIAHQLDRDRIRREKQKFKNYLEHILLAYESETAAAVGRFSDDEADTANRQSTNPAARVRRRALSKSPLKSPSLASAFTRSREFATYAGLVLVPQPELNAAFEPLFEPDWMVALRTRLDEFLSLLGLSGVIDEGGNSHNTPLNAADAVPSQPQALEASYDSQAVDERDIVLASVDNNADVMGSPEAAMSLPDTQRNSISAADADDAGSVKSGISQLTDDSPSNTKGRHESKREVVFAAIPPTEPGVQQRIEQVMKPHPIVTGISAAAAAAAASNSAMTRKSPMQSQVDVYNKMLRVMRAQGKSLAPPNGVLVNNLSPPQALAVAAKKKELTLGTRMQLQVDQCNHFIKLQQTSAPAASTPTPASAQPNGLSPIPVPNDSSSSPHNLTMSDAPQPLPAAPQHPTKQQQQPPPPPQRQSQPSVDQIERSTEQAVTAEANSE